MKTKSLKKLIFKNRWAGYLTDAWLRGCIFISGLLSTGLALADDPQDPKIGGGDISHMADQGKKAANSVKNTLWAVAQVAGICMALHGLLKYKAISENKANGSVGKCIGEVVVGAFLFFLPTVMGVGATTFLGS